MSTWEVRRNDDGTVDEVVLRDGDGQCVAHLEQLSNHVWYLGIYEGPNDGAILQLNLWSHSRVHVQAEGPDRHP
jgi:hypothetical protein